MSSGSPAFTFYSALMDVLFRQFKIEVEGRRRVHANHLKVLRHETQKACTQHPSTCFLGWRHCLFSPHTKGLREQLGEKSHSNVLQSSKCLAKF